MPQARTPPPPAATRRRLTGEMLGWVLTGSALIVFGAIAYWPLLSRGGFALDDWAGAARVHFPSPGQSPIQATSDAAGSRVVQMLYIVGTFKVLGTNAQAHIALAVGIGLGTSLLLFGVLRSYRVPRLLASGAAVLSFILPAGVVAKAWPNVAADELGILFFLAGLLAAHRAFATRRRRLHVLSVVLFAAALFEKESILPWVAASVLWYLPVASRHRAIRRWLVDLVVVATAVVAARLAPAPAQGHSAIHTWPSHARELAAGGLQTIWDTLTLYRLPTPAPVAACAVMLVLAVAVGLARAGRRDSDREATRAAWTLVAAAAAGLLALAIYIPANPALLPQLPGTLGRSAVAFAVPTAIVGAGAIYAVALLISLAAPTGPVRRRLSGALFGAVLLAVAIGATAQTRRETTAWAEAASREARLVATVQDRVPAPAASAAFVVLNAPDDVAVDRGESASTMTVFAEPFVLTSALRTQFQRNDVFGVSVRPGDVVECLDDSLTVVRPGFPFPLTANREYGPERSLYGLRSAFHTRGSIYNIPSAAYGLGVVVDLRRGRASTPMNREECLRATTGGSLRS